METTVKKRKAASAPRKPMRLRRQLRILDLKGQVQFDEGYDYKPLRHRKKPT